MVLGFIVQPIHILLNFQAPNIGAIMDNNTYQIIRDEYSIRHRSRKFLFIYLFYYSWLHVVYLCGIMCASFTIKSLLLSCEILEIKWSF
jgi:hypothetical protein